MPRESQLERSARALRVLAALDKAMPEARIELDYRTPFELLVAVILAAQCTDKRVNLVTPALFARFPDARAMAAAPTPGLEALVKSCGFFRAKSRALKAVSSALLAGHRGEVPKDRALLAALPQMPHDKKLHKTLALVYKQLNMPDMAAQHQKLVDATTP